VYGSQQGTFSVTARVTIAVTAVSCIICGILTVVYSNFKLSRVKKQHQRELGRQSEFDSGEGIVEKMKRKGNEPELEPGSLV
jgi:hypothetical protein